MKGEFYVIGAGPGGAGAAWRASREGFRVVVFEASSKLASKPCGKGVPLVGDLPMRIPRDVVYHRIRRAVMYVNGRLLFEYERMFDGYIVDKAAMLEALIVENGGELVTRAKYKPGSGVVTSPTSSVELRGRGPGQVKGVFAGGHAYYSGEKIMAIQYIASSVKEVDEETLEIYFDTQILGYYYVFPAGPGKVEIGVGGFPGFQSLKRGLDHFMKRDPRFRQARVEKLEGARIAVGGLRLGHINGLPLVGEAAGFVLPLTGEGIRPSIISGYEAAGAIIEGADVLERLNSTRISRAVRIQRSILEKVKAMDPREREKLLSMLPREAHAEIALGTLNMNRIARSLVDKPQVAVRLLSILR
ncbi:MAG: NAD(P)/FAD-dependent oxidoreductase [Desulfurococcales archaeon]|nr:NAD(P)/FAD-dependent oxidoreductase [Desulfurococcales archaeon]